MGTIVADGSATVARLDAADETVDFREDLRQRFLNGEYQGIEVDTICWLRSRVPAEYRQSDELQQQVAFFVLEAIERFDPSRNTKFSSFLIGHLKLRRWGYQQYLWVRSSGNENCRMLPMGPAGARLSEGRPHPRRGDRDERNETSDTRLQRFDSLCVRSEAESICSVKEMMEAMSDEARDYLGRLFDYEDQDALLQAFQTKHFRSKVSKATGLSKRQVDVLASEVKRKFPDHILT